MRCCWVTARPMAPRNDCRWNWSYFHAPSMLHLPLLPITLCSPSVPIAADKDYHHCVVEVPLPHMFVSIVLLPLTCARPSCVCLSLCLSICVSIYLPVCLFTYSNKHRPQWNDCRHKDGSLELSLLLPTLHLQLEHLGWACVHVCVYV